MVRDIISIKELGEMAKRMFGNLVKAVVDIERGVMAVDGELHADEEKLLLEDGSKQENFWGINIYPEIKDETERIEFDSMINLRPSQKNMSRGVEDPKIQEKILAITRKLINEK